MKRTHILAIGTAFSAAVGIAYWAGSARADIPTTDVLTYSGFLELNGSTVTDQVDIEVTLHDALTGGAELCSTEANSHEVSNGHFTVTLDDSCIAGVEANSNVWVHVRVGGSLLNPRAKLGAVPYAIEAKNAENADNATIATDATNASNATVASNLDNRLVQIESRLGAVEVFSGPADDYSLNGTFCGKTTTTYDGGTGANGVDGYDGAKAKCEALAACNSSPTAHMCTLEEIVRSVSTGLTVNGVGLGGWMHGPNDGDSHSSCNGWVVTDTSNSAHAWNYAGNRPTQFACNNSLEILCCD